MRLLQVAQLQPLAGEVAHEALRAAGPPACRRTCCSSTAGLRSRAAAGQVEQLVVGNAAPQEERQPRRQLDVADADRPRRARRVGRIALDAEHELRAREDALQRQPGCRSRSCRRAGPPRRTPAAAACPRRSPDGDTRAGPGSTGSARRTGPRRRDGGLDGTPKIRRRLGVSTAGHVEGARDRQGLDVRTPGVVVGVDRAAQVRLQGPRVRHVGPVQERGANRVRTRP